MNKNKPKETLFDSFYPKVNRVELFLRLIETNDEIYIGSAPCTMGRGDGFYKINKTRIPVENKITEKIKGFLVGYLYSDEYDLPVSDLLIAANHLYTFSPDTEEFNIY